MAARTRRISSANRNCSKGKKSGTVTLVLALLALLLLPLTLLLASAGHARGERWAHCVGLDASACETYVQSVLPRETVDAYYFVVLPEGSFVTRDYRWNRVRIFVDKHGRVVEPPING